jgi:CubicO group peptidase (beta-lactamase class C family)
MSKYDHELANRALTVGPDHHVADGSGLFAGGLSRRSRPSRPPIDYAALETAVDNAITTGPATLDNMREVLIDVDDETKIAHYRHVFHGDDHEHVWSVTKSVLSTLIGIATADGLIADLDQPLSALLPEHQ